MIPNGLDAHYVQLKGTIFLFEYMHNNTINQDYKSQDSIE